VPGLALWRTGPSCGKRSGPGVAVEGQAVEDKWVVVWRYEISCRDWKRGMWWKTAAIQGRNWGILQSAVPGCSELTTRPNWAKHDCSTWNGFSFWPSFCESFHVEHAGHRIPQVLRGANALL